MVIELHNLKPQYMSESEVAGSDIYLQPALTFESGKKYMVKAKSGHGKTSLLNFIYGNSPHFDGTIDIRCGNGETISATSHTCDLLFPLRRDKLSYLFQDLCLFEELTARENVIIKNNLTHHKCEADIDDMLAQLLPPEKKDQPLRTLSLGQRQRVAVVRSLCQPFEFLLMDEPFSHIDRQNASAVVALVLKEVALQGAGLIVTTLDQTDLFPFDSILNL